MSLLTGINSYYPFDGTPADATGTNTSTAAGSPTYPACKINQGLSNNGNNTDYISSPVNVGGGSWGFSGWVKRTGAVTTYAASFAVNASNFTGLYVNPSNFLSIYGAGDIRPGTGTIPLNVWTHVAVTYDGTTVLFYVNGAAAGSWTGTVGGGTTLVNSFAANNSIWGAFPGLVDEFGFWTRVLTPTEVSDLYNSGAGLAYPFTVAVPVVVSAIYPNTAPEAGGVWVSITGSGFQAGAGVTFGGVAATSVVVLGATLITCYVPAHIRGVVDVVVTNLDASTNTFVAGFTYTVSGAGLPVIDFSAGVATATPRARALAFDFKTGTFVRVNGRITFTVDRPAIAQAVSIRLQSFRGEWFLDTENGLPYFDQILIKSPNMKAIEQTIRREIESVPGIKSIKSLIVNYDRPHRTLSVTWIADSDLGELNGTTILKP